MDATPQVIPAHSLLGGAENMKLLFDSVMSLQSQLIADNQANARAWNALNLRRAQNAATFDNLLAMTSAIAGETGETLEQQNASPVSQGEGQSAAAQAYPANRSVDVAAAGVATANQSVADAVANLMNALTAVIVTASGGASTPSQTEAKPAS